MRSFLLFLKTENLKIRKTFALKMTVLFPLFTVVLVSLALSGTKITVENPWLQYNYNLNSTAAFFYPYFLVIMIAYAIFLENRSNTWKYLLTQPLPKITVFLGKLTLLMILLMLSYVLFVLFAYLSSQVLHWIDPGKFHFSKGGIPPGKMCLFLGKTYLSGLLIIVMQYWISLRSKNLVLPIVIGTGLILLPIAVLIVLGMAGLINQPKLIEDVFRYDPYSYPFAHIFNFMKGPAIKVVLLPRLSMLFGGFAIVLGILSYLDFRRRNF